MFCRKCGNEMLDDSMFCPKCGQMVESVSDNQKRTIQAQEIIITPTSEKASEKNIASDNKKFEDIYQKAAQLQKEKNFKEAAEIYATIPNYKDSQDKLNKCRQNIKRKEQTELKYKQDIIFTLSLIHITEPTSTLYNSYDVFC